MRKGFSNRKEAVNVCQPKKAKLEPVVKYIPFDGVIIVEVIKSRLWYEKGVTLEVKDFDKEYYCTADRADPHIIHLIFKTDCKIEK